MDYLESLRFLHDCHVTQVYSNTTITSFYIWPVFYEVTFYKQQMVFSQGFQRTCLLSELENLIKSSTLHLKREYLVKRKKKI